jgi:hypothetical protein
MARIIIVDVYITIVILGITHAVSIKDVTLF